MNERSINKIHILCMCRSLEEQGKSWELKLTETNSVSSFPTLCITIFTVLVSLSVFPTTIYNYTKSDEQTQYLFQFEFKLSCVQQEFKHSSWVISTGRYHLSKGTTPLKQIKCCQTKNKRFILCSIHAYVQWNFQSLTNQLATSSLK